MPIHTAHRNPMTTPAVAWQGVFPALTTQFRDDFSLEIDATAAVIGALVRDGVSGLVICGTAGENTSLTRAEKSPIMETAVSVAAGCVPVICGAAEFTSVFAIETTKEAARQKVDGMAKVVPLCEWFMPLLHLDARPDLVQCIKLCEHLVGHGSWRTRPPRLALPDADRTFVEQAMANALKHRPALPDVGLARP